MQIKPFHFTSFDEADPSAPPVFTPHVLDASDAPSDAAADGQQVIHPPTAPAVPENRFTEEELQNARKEGHEEGFMAGKQEGLRAVDHAQAQQQASLTQLMQSIHQEALRAAELHQEWPQHTQQELASLTLEAAKKVAGSALAESPTAQIEAMISECTQHLFSQTGITLTLHPEAAIMVREKPEFANFTLVENTTLSVTDCQIDWPYGHASHDNSVIWQEIHAILERHFTHDTLNHTQQPETAKESS